MEKNWCYRCNGSGKIQSLMAKWWQVWKMMECPICDGTGEMQPPKEKPKGYPEDATEIILENLREFINDNLTTKAP